MTVSLPYYFACLPRLISDLQLNIYPYGRWIGCSVAVAIRPKHFAFTTPAPIPLITIATKVMVIAWPALITG